MAIKTFAEENVLTTYFLKTTEVFNCFNDCQIEYSTHVLNLTALTYMLGILFYNIKMVFILKGLQWFLAFASLPIFGVLFCILIGDMG